MKLEVGKQYKTRGGWRAVCVEVTKCGTYPFIVYHTNHGIVNHCHDGGFDVMDGLHDYDLVAEWKDPETKTAYVHWCILNGKECVFSHGTGKKLSGYSSYKAIAKVTLVEGQFDE